MPINIQLFRKNKIKYYKCNCLYLLVELNLFIFYAAKSKKFQVLYLKSSFGNIFRKRKKKKLFFNKQKVVITLV